VLPVSTPGPLAASSTQTGKPAVASRVSGNDLAIIRDPIRQLALYAALGAVFLRFSFLHEYLTYRGAGNTYLLYVFSVPALIGMIATGGLARAFSGRIMFFWVGLSIWFFLGIPVSTWPGDSLREAVSYARTVMPIALMLAGLPVIWKEIRLILYSIAAAALTSILIGLIAGQNYGTGRIGLEFGTVRNPNDYAGHLILVLPIVAFSAFHPPKIPFCGKIAGIIALIGLAVGFYFVLGSGSRGALLAVLLSAVLIFLRSRMPVRFAMLFAIPVLGLIMMSLLPAHTLDRFLNYSTDSIDQSNPLAEVQDSTRIRQYLLERAIIDTFQHPVLGVGAGQFPNYEGARQGVAKATNSWLSPHNSFAQISSENGFPGLFLYVGGVLLSFLGLRRIGKQVEGRPEFKEVTQVCFYLTIGLGGYTLAVMFLNFAYFYYFPAIGGLVAAITRIVGQQIAEQDSSKPSPAVRVPFPVPQRPVLTLDVKGAQAQGTGKRFRFNGYR
jgi:hypothetical protein